MAEEDVELDRRLGKELFNRVWEFLNLDQRTPEQEAEMIHTVHAMAYHWGRVGEGPRLARADDLGSPDTTPPRGHFAPRSLADA